jgi:hypothetical protein
VRLFGVPRTDNSLRHLVAGLCLPLPRPRAPLMVRRAGPAAQLPGGSVRLRPTFAEPHARRLLAARRAPACAPGQAPRRVCVGHARTSVGVCRTRPHECRCVSDTPTRVSVCVGHARTSVGVCLTRPHECRCVSDTPARVSGTRRILRAPCLPGACPVPRLALSDCLRWLFGQDHAA